MRHETQRQWACLLHKEFGRNIKPHHIHCWRRITQQFDQTFVKSRIGLISESQGTVNGMELRPRVKGKYFDNQGQEIWQNNAKIANNSLSASPQTRKQKYTWHQKYFPLMAPEARLSVSVVTSCGGSQWLSYKCHIYPLLNTASWFIFILPPSSH